MLVLLVFGVSVKILGMVVLSCFIVMLVKMLFWRGFFELGSWRLSKSLWNALVRDSR